MYRWEVATALAGALLDIHPFDQPNVQESKDNTSRVLREARESGQMAPAPPDVCLGADAVASLLAQAPARAYVALQAYLPPTQEVERRLQALRALIRDQFQVATTLGFGPRFLHSTGQLHKGGPASGVFLQLTYRPADDLPVPGQPYSFGKLLAAQALGDLQSLRARQLPVARVDLEEDVLGGLDRLMAAVMSYPRGV
jgi:transaldolase/glucose-6-phosphate isomerase